MSDATRDATRPPSSKPPAPGLGSAEARRGADRVEREVELRVSPQRAFAGLTDPALFPTWGPERIEGRLAPGERPILDFGPSGGGKVAVYVVAFEPPRYFAFRWAQGATDPAVLLGDPLAVPNTLVEFSVEEAPGGARVRVVESGISALPGMAAEPPALDASAALENMGKGWQLMLGGLARALAGGGAPASADRVESELALAARPERVYAALLEPTAWWAQKVEGRIAPGERAVLDFGPLGRFRIAVVAAESGRRLAFRWISWTEDEARRLDDPLAAPSTQVEFALEPDPASGGTRLRHSESGFEALAAALAPAAGAAPAAPAAGEGAVLTPQQRAQRGWGIVLGMLELHLAPR